MGSVFDVGHNPRVGFFRAPQVEPSAFTEGPIPFVCEFAVTVEVEEAEVESDEAEFDRWTVLRGINMR